MRVKKRKYTISELVWKNRFEVLINELNDIEIRVKNMNLHRMEKRLLEDADEIYVSFGYDVVATSEEEAIKNFGEGNYDVYRIHKRSPKE